MEDSRGHSRRRGSRHPALVRIGDGPLWGLPSTQEEISSGAGESGGLSRRRRRRRRTRRSGTRSQSQASSSGGAADSDLAANLPLTLPGNPNQALPYSSALRSDHPGTRAHVRQSVLYSDRPRRNRPRRPALAEEYTCEERSSELGRAVMDLPTVEALSLSDCPLLSASDSSFIPQSTEEKPPKDSDADKEESMRLIREYYVKNPPTSLKQAIEELLVVEHATLTALAAEWGTEPPPPRKPFPVDQETQSLEAEEHASAAVAEPESIAPRQPSHEASMEEIIENGKRWMRDEVMMCFRKYAESVSRVKILEGQFDELCHQCCNVEDHNKVFHHYNFKVKTREPDSVDWTVRLYFAEVKEIFGRKYYFCWPLEPNEDGPCYACMKQGVEDLKHPATGGFEMGFTDATLFGYAED